MGFVPALFDRLGRAGLVRKTGDATAQSICNLCSRSAGVRP